MKTKLYIFAFIGNTKEYKINLILKKHTQKTEVTEIDSVLFKEDACYFLVAMIKHRDRSSLQKSLLEGRESILTGTQESDR